MKELVLTLDARIAADQKTTEKGSRNNDLARRGDSVLDEGSRRQKKKETAVTEAARENHLALDMFREIADLVDRGCVVLGQKFVVRLARLFRWDRLRREEIGRDRKSRTGSLETKDNW
ncbi:MAG: hypothetical protein MMC33_006733 [Icmadophila ericetorum]|nr:hypothetical protein [Icmadophila ericetorum]